MGGEAGSGSLIRKRAKRAITASQRTLRSAFALSGQALGCPSREAQVLSFNYSDPPAIAPMMGAWLFPRRH